jgi:hypothetical protein
MLPTMVFRRYYCFFCVCFDSVLIVANFIVDFLDSLIQVNACLILASICAIVDKMLAVSIMTNVNLLLFLLFKID